MREPREVVLGDKTWTVRPLTIAQVEQIDGILNDKNLAGVPRLLKIIEVGLGKQTPPVDFKMLKEIEAGLDDIDAAARVVFQLAGIKLKEPRPGEALAAA